MRTPAAESSILRAWSGALQPKAPVPHARRSAPDPGAAGDKGHAVLRPPHAWSANTERKLIARVEQERFALSVLQHAGRICFHP